MHQFPLIWQGLKQDSRLWEVRILLLALMVAITSIACVDFFSNRIYRAVDAQMSSLLAADLRLINDQPLPDVLALEIDRRGMRSTDVTTFSSAMVIGDEVQLVAVKAVTAGYPLKGQLKVKQTLEGVSEATNLVPAVGEVWLAPRLLLSFDLQVGDLIELGAMQFKIGRILSFEPDRRLGVQGVFPRLMMNADDLAAAQLIIPGSQVRYQRLVTGPENEIATLKTWIEERSAFENTRIRMPSNTEPGMQRILDNITQYLGLAAMAAVILSGAAIAMMSHAYVKRQAQAVALLRCFGSAQQRVFNLFLIRLLLLVFATCIVSLLLGYWAQYGLSQAMDELLAMDLATDIGWRPIASGMLSGVIITVGLILPSLYRLRGVSVLNVLRQEVGAPTASTLRHAAIAIGCLLLLLLWRGGWGKIAWVSSASFFIAFLLFIGFSYLVISQLKYLREPTRPGWSLGFSALLRRRTNSVVLVVSFAFGITTLLLLAMVRNDLMDAWQDASPTDAPDHFLINIQPQDTQAMTQALKEIGIPSPTLFPVSLARLDQVNGVDLLEHVEGEKRRIRHSEYRVSNHGAGDSPNMITEGRWWRDDELDKPYVSVADHVMESLDLKLGDKMLLRFGSVEKELEILSVREVEWEDNNINFFLLTPPAVFEDVNQFYITSFLLPENADKAVAKLVRQFPSINIFDVRYIVEFIRSTVSKGTLAIQYVLYFMLSASVIVLIATAYSSRDERLRESALLRTLGANQQHIHKTLLGEYILVGLIASGLAVVIATGIAYVLIEHVLELSFTLNAPYIAITLLIGVASISLVGWSISRTVVRQPPLAILKK